MKQSVQNCIYIAGIILAAVIAAIPFVVKKPEEKCIICDHKTDIVFCIQQNDQKKRISICRLCAYEAISEYFLKK